MYTGGGRLFYTRRIFWGRGVNLKKKKNFFVFARTRARALTTAKNSKKQPFKAVKSRMHARCGARYPPEAHRGQHRPCGRIPDTLFVRWQRPLQRLYSPVMDYIAGSQKRRRMRKQYLTPSAVLIASSIAETPARGAQEPARAAKEVYSILCSSNGGCLYKGFTALLWASSGANKKAGRSLHAEQWSSHLPILIKSITR